MSNSETTIPIGDWSIGSLKVYEDEKLVMLRQLVDERKDHFDELRAADQRALQIKETGDAKALDLAREIQVYKDEKANQLREQINSERGLYVTQVQFKPISDYITSEQGSSNGLKNAWAYLLGGLGGVATIIGVILAFNN